MRNFPPISTSSPRDTITSPDLASVLRHKRTAAALLFTTRAASAPVRRQSKDSKCAFLSPLSPRCRSYSRLEYSAAITASLSACSRLSGARPRFVCKIVPVPLITLRIFGVYSSSRLLLILSGNCSTAFNTSVSSTDSPIRIRTRSSSSCTTRLTQDLPYRSSNFRIPSSSNKTSTFGILRYS